MEMLTIWLCVIVFALGILAGFFIKWVFTEERESFIRRMIFEGAVRLEFIMNSAMSKRIAQNEETQQKEFSFLTNLHEELMQNNRAYSEKQADKYDELRRVEKETAAKERQVIYQLPQPPEAMMDNFCSEDWMFELDKLCSGKNVDMRSYLPWFRGMMMAGYTKGKKTGFEFAMAQKKGKKK